MTVDLPQYPDFDWPMVVALRELGGSATIEELNAQVINDQGFTEDQQAVIHKDGPMTELEYRLKWRRTWLKGMGLATSSERGVLTLTPEGRTVTEDEIKAIINEGTEQGTIEEAEQEIIERVFHLGDRNITSLMTHRSDIIWFDLDENEETMKEKIIREPHSVYPICDGEIDNIKGAGGTAIAVASDEAGRSGKPDPWKRDRLIGVGADLVIPDFREFQAVCDYLWRDFR